MSSANDFGDFLVSRRARVTPEQVGLPQFGRRRVPGLRREEVASLAGVGIDYYRRLERGQASGASHLVLEAIARALQLDDAERAHLFDLAHSAGPATPAPRRTPGPRVRPVIQRLVDSIDAPAIIRNRRSDYIGANRLGRALYAPVFESPEGPPNSVRFAFLDPAARTFYADWEHTARELVAALRSIAGREPHDRDLADLVGELSTRSPEFAGLWATHDVRLHRLGSKTLDHPVVGPLTLNFEVFEPAGDPGVSITLYDAEPGSRSAETLALLASWSAPTPIPSSTPQE